MEKVYYSDQTYDLLAHQLVEEQAELVKRQGAVDSIKKAIFQKKESVIANALFLQRFRIDGKTYLGMYVKGKRDGDIMRFEVVLMRDKYELSKLGNLTKKEKELLQKFYQTEYLMGGKGVKDELLDLYEKLRFLKNGIEIFSFYHANFSFDEAMKPDFFKQSDIVVDKSYRFQMKVRMLEDCRINY